ncbi:hypothetical protein JCM10212_001200 [Sporobolomyces blumeae]
MALQDDAIELDRYPAALAAAAPSFRSTSPTREASAATVPSSGALKLVGAGSREHEEDTATRLRRLSTSKGSEAGTALEPVDRGRGAWTFVVAATILETFIWGFGTAFSVVLVHLETHKPWSEASLAALSSIGTVQLGLMFFLTFFVNNAFRRYPDKAKMAILISSAVYSLSMLISGWATQVWQLILLQGICAGLSGAVLYGPVLLWTSDWFYHRRGLASGIIFAGTGLGGFAFPFLIGKILDDYGFAWLCRIWGILTAVVFFSASLVIRPRIPPVKPHGPRPKWFMTNRKTLNHPVVWTVSITTLIASLAYFPVALYLPIYTTSLLHSSDSFTPNLVVAVFNLVAFIASTVIGYCSDKSLAATATLIGVTGSAIALGAWSTATTVTKIFVFSAIFGATTPISSYWGAASREVAGTDPYLSSTLLCGWGMIRGLASIVAPFISAGLYNEKDADSTDSFGRFGFRGIIVFVGVMSFVSSFGGVVLGFLKFKSDAARRRTPAIEVCILRFGESTEPRGFDSVHRVSTGSDRALGRSHLFPFGIVTLPPTMAAQTTTATQTVELESFSPSGPSSASSPSLTPTSDPSQSRPSATTAQGEPPDAHLRRLRIVEGPDDQLPPQDRGRKAWQFVAAAFILDWGFVSSSSAVLVWFQTHEPWSQSSLASLSSIATVQLALLYLLPIFVVNGFRRYPEYAKVALLAAACCFSLSFVAASFATEVWHLVVLQGGVAGIAGAVLYAPCVSYLSEWFVDKRGLASGLIFSGTGLGGLAFPFLISKLLDRYGFAGMSRIWAAVVGVASIASVLAIEPRIPPRKPKDGKRGPWLVLDWVALRKPLFWIMAGLVLLVAIPPFPKTDGWTNPQASTIFLSSLAYFPVSLYLATYTASALHSSSLFLPSVVVAAFNASAFVGSSLIGWTADRSLSGTIIALGTSGALVAFLAWGFSSSLAAIMVFAVLYGIGSRISSYFGPGAREIAGSNSQASTTVQCFFGLARGIASILGPFIATSLYKENLKDSDQYVTLSCPRYPPIFVQTCSNLSGEWGRWGFRKVIIFVGTTSAASALGGLAVNRMKRKSKGPRAR